MGWYQQNLIGSGPHQIRDRHTHLTAQRFAAITIDLSGLCQDHHPLGSRDGIGCAKYRDAPLDNAVDVADRLLHLIGVDVAAGTNNGVFAAAGDKDIAAADVADVTGVEPFPIKESAALLRIMEVAAGR